MPTPSSGAISFSQIAQIIKNNATTTISLNEADARTLIGVSSGQISMSSAYGKPVAGSASYTPGSYTFYVPVYQYLSIDLAGGGGGGNGGSGCSTCTCTCCCVPGWGGGWYPYNCSCCNNCGGGGAGGTGGDSGFNGAVAYGGTASAGGGVVAAGNVSSSTTGGGGAGGAGGAAYGCCGSNGAAGGGGGRIQTSWTKGSNGPAYGAAINFYVGGGAGGGSSGGGTGGNGWLTVSWS